MFRAKRAKQVAQNNAALTTSVVSSAAIGPASNVSASTIGSTSSPMTASQAGVVITRSQCKNICRGKCGSRVGFGKRVKASRECWKGCKANTCGWEQGDL